MELSQSSIEALSALAIGFAFSGLVASGFEVLVRRPLGFSALQTGDLRALASIPLLIFSAPLIIVRNILRGRQGEGRPMPFVMAATIIACFWSILCGRLVLDFALLLTHA